MRFLQGKLNLMCMCMLRPLIGCRCACGKFLFITWARCKRWTLNAIHQKNHYPVDRVECYHNTYRCILIHSVDSVIHPLNNRGLVFWEFFFSWFPPSKWFYIKRVLINVGSLQFCCLFLTGPRLIVHDNAFNLHSYCLNRDLVFFKNSQFLVDRLHWQDHAGT